VKMGQCTFTGGAQDLETQRPDGQMVHRVKTWIG